MLVAEQAYHGKPLVKPRLTFEEFTNNATLVERLRQIYSTPDEVDMLVAQELDPTWWRAYFSPRLGSRLPETGVSAANTVIPTAQLAISFCTRALACLLDCEISSWARVQTRCSWARRSTASR